MWCLLSAQSLCLQLHPATHQCHKQPHPAEPRPGTHKPLEPTPAQPLWRRECCPRSCCSWQGSSPGSEPALPVTPGCSECAACSPRTALWVQFNVSPTLPCSTRASFMWGHKDLTHQVPAGISMGRISHSFSTLTTFRAPPSPASPLLQEIKVNTGAPTTCQEEEKQFPVSTGDRNTAQKGEGSSRGS